MVDFSDDDDNDDDNIMQIEEFNIDFEADFNSTMNFLIK